MERQNGKSESADRRLLTLQREVSDAEDRLKRLYRSIEDGIVELDDILRDRTATLKLERERAKAALDRARVQCGTSATIDPAKIDAFSRLMTEKLDNGDTNARKGYIRSIVEAIEVDDKAIRIIGNKDVLQATRTDMFVVLHANGAPDTIRTCGLRLRRATLYPAELRVLTAYAVLTRISRMSRPQRAALASHCNIIIFLPHFSH